MQTIKAHACASVCVFNSLSPIPLSLSLAFRYVDVSLFAKQFHELTASFG